MTQQEAEKFADQIRKEAAVSVRVKVGQTNGRYLVHVIQNEVEDRREASFNVTHAGQWATHPLNKVNRKRKAEQVDEAGLVESFVNDVIDSTLSRLSRAARAAVTN